MSEVARLLLAAVFAIAGLAKLADREGSLRSVRDFGAPARLASPLALLLPLAELAIAVGLVPAATARPAAAAGALLLTVFTGGVVVALLRGRTPDCHCFGRLHSAPAGWGTVGRNAAFVALAAFAASQHAADPTWLELGVAGAAIALGAQALLSFVLLRRYGRALRRLEELEAGTQPRALEVGATAPAFALPAVNGGEVTLAELLGRGRPLLLFFTDPNCGSCHALLPRIGEWQRSLAKQLTVAVVTRGDRDENLAIAEEHDLTTVLVQGDVEVNELYGTLATPSAVLVAVDGRIERAAVAGGDAIGQLVRTLAPVQPTAPVSDRARFDLVAAASVAGGVALAAGSAAASGRAQDQTPPNPELRAINAALAAAERRVLAAAQRTLKAERGLATLAAGRALRGKRTAAREALAAERHTVLAIRAAVSKLPGTSREAHNVKVMIDNSLSLHARSLAKRQQAIGATSKAARRLLADSQELFLMSVSAGSAARELLGPAG